MRLFLTLLLLSVAGLGCDTTDPDPTADAELTVTVETNGPGSGGDGRPARASDALLSVGTVTVRIEPLLEPPAETELSDRYLFLEGFLDALEPVLGPHYVPGYYRIREDSDADAAVVLAPAECDDETSCLIVSGSDTRLDGAEDGTGAVFFPVDTTATDEQPPVRLRPFALGGSGRLTFTGRNDDQLVAAPRVTADPVVSADGSASVLVQRGTETDDILVVVRRGAAVETAVLDDGQGAIRVISPEGDAPAEVFLLHLGT